MSRVAQWLSGYWAGLAISRSRVGVPAAALPRSTWASCLHTCASVTKQYNLVPANRRWYSAAGEVTAGLALSNGSLPPGLWLRSPSCRLTAENRDKLRNPTPVSGRPMGVPLPLTLALMSLNGVACAEMSSTDTVYCWLAVRHLLVARWSGDLPASGSQYPHNAQSLLSATLTSHLNIFIWRGQKAGCQWRTQESNAGAAMREFPANLECYNPPKSLLRSLDFFAVLRLLMKLFFLHNF